MPVLAARRWRTALQTAPQLACGRCGRATSLRPDGTYVDDENRDPASFVFSKRCFQPLLQLLRIARTRPRRRRLYLVVPEPEHPIYPVATGVVIAGVFCDQLVAQSTPELPMPIPLYCHRHVECPLRNTDVRAPVVGVAPFPLSVAADGFEGFRMQLDDADIRPLHRPSTSAGFDGLSSRCPTACFRI